MKRYFNSAFAIGLLLISSITFADDDNRRGNGRGPPDFVGNHNSRNFDRDRNHRRNDRPAYRSDNRRYERDHGDSVSINLSFGARPFGYNPFGYNMLGYRPDPYNSRYNSRQRSRQPTIIYQNNTYIDEPSYSSSSSYVTRRTNRQGVSLLRDSSGRCFERYRDARGNETRTELPRSDCNF